MLAERDVRKRFKELLRGVQSTREMAERITHEPEPMRSLLSERLERWRKGDIPLLPRIKGQEHFAKIILWLLFLSPILGFTLDILRAISGQFRESMAILADPGHRRIRIYDTMIVCMSAGVTLYIMFVGNTSGFTLLGSGQAFFDVLFPQLTGWTNLLLVYAASALVHFYTVKRDDIIRQVNERAGAW